MTRRLGALLVSAGLLIGCGRGRSAAADSVAARRGAIQSASHAPASFAIGRAATAEEISAWDLDVNPDGVGLPAGRASASDGTPIYAAKCASCHGSKGEGVAPNPPIVGREPREGFPFGQVQGHVKTVGNYWPYATTVYDYLRRAMPQDKPGSLTPNELYALTAWILAENGIIAHDMILDSASLPGIKMPARDRFVRDDRLSTPSFR